ncbi:MAG: TonB-dependent receptor plug domain-containing protein [Bacteroidota bacterium]
MKIRLSILGLALISSLSFFAFTVAEDPFTELLKKLEEFTRKYPQEKVHLHLDKPYYAIGDDIWFKAYVIDSKTSMPTNVSNILYVELINQKDSLLKQLRLPIQSGISWGDFKLPDPLTEGNYRIRAYTNWMNNAGPESFFEKTIKVGNLWTNKVLTKMTNNTIRFTNATGNVYANSQVNYEIQSGNKLVTRGKTLTNAAGEISLNMLNTQPARYTSGKVIATITLPTLEKIVKIIPIPAFINTVDVQFFPEGGNLVGGLPARIAIKAVNTNGLGENIGGRIVDEQNNEILTFETTYLGMGSVFFTPEFGENYTAQVKFKNGAEQNIKLPEVEKSGYMLAVNNLDSAKMTIKIALSPDLMNKGMLNLLIQHNGNAFFMAQVSTDRQAAAVVVPKDNIPSGIVQVTLFSASNQPVAERMVFVNNITEKIDLSVQNLNAIYHKRSKVEPIFRASNLNNPLQGNFSVAVTNASIVDPEPENESNILTSLLLTSELKGYIEKPNHYFLNDDEKTQKELDNLLLTQGWRKIDWSNLDFLPAQSAAKTVASTQYLPEKNLKISGRVTKGFGPMVNGKITLLSSLENSFPLDTLTDADGRFNFSPLNFSDSTKFVVQARTEKDKANVNIYLDSIPMPPISANTNNGDIETNVNETMMDYLKQSNTYFEEQYKRGFLNKAVQLKTVEIVEKKKTASKYSSNKAGRADLVFDAEDLKYSTSLSTFLPGKIPSIVIRGNKAYSLRGFPPLPVNIMIDGTIIRDYNLEDIVVSNIESIEVLVNRALAAIYGPDGSNGLIIITTKKGQNSYSMFAPGVVSFTPKGYYAPRQFYSPKYDIQSDLKPDLRTTVYWNPNIISGQDGTFKLDYFNTDRPGNYRIVIEGIDDFGYTVHQTFTYQVN